MMSISPSTRTIGTLTVTTEPLPVFRALDLLPELMEIQGEGDVTAIAKALGNGRLRSLLPRLMATTKVLAPEDPKAVKLDSVEAFDGVFYGRLGMLPEVIGFALEVSFADFFAGLQRMLKTLRSDDDSKNSEASRE